MISDKTIGVNLFRGSSHFRVTGHQRLLKREVLPKIALFGPVLQPFRADLAKITHKIPYFGGCTCTNHHVCVCRSQTLCCTVYEPTTGSVGVITAKYSVKCPFFSQICSKWRQKCRTTVIFGAKSRLSNLCWAVTRKWLLPRKRFTPIVLSEIMRTFRI